MTDDGIVVGELELANDPLCSPFCQLSVDCWNVKRRQGNERYEIHNSRNRDLPHHSTCLFTRHRLHLSAQVHPTAPPTTAGATRSLGMVTPLIYISNPDPDEVDVRKEAPAIVHTVRIVHVSAEGVLQRNARRQLAHSHRLHT